MVTPPKPKKTPRQLADMIASRMRIGDGSAIVIHPNKKIGWTAVVLATKHGGSRSKSR